VAAALSDETLFEKARRGDQDAFKFLYQRHRNAVFDFLYRLSGSAEVAEDITHDCFLRLMRGSDSLVISTSFLIRLYSTARSLAMERFHDRRPTINEADHGTDDPSSTLKIRTAITSLPLLEREVLILSQYEGLDLDQIATIVDADEKTVADRIDSARERLKVALADLT
jgi:RNA polymerase sigma-70 factor (ECF subfamily)